MKNIYIKLLISISVIGAFSSGFGYLSISNYLWSISNPLLAQYNFKHNNSEQGYLFIIFAIAAWIYVVINIGETIK